MKLILPALSLALAAFTAQAQIVVFDTMSVRSNEVAATQTQNNWRYADDATLINPAGETIGQIDIAIAGQYETTANMFAFLLDATGPSGAPGNTLWSSSASGVLPRRRLPGYRQLRGSKYFGSSDVLLGD